MNAVKEPRFSFGMIVFNGSEFLRETLTAIYDDAYEIVIVEGSDEHARALAHTDGSSTDNTVSIIKHFPDPERKIRLIQGAWKDKTESTNEYLKYMHGDYVWHVDDDEIYKKEDIARVRARLKNDPSITAVSFHFIDFFKGFEWVLDTGNETKRREIWRIFKFVPGSHYSTHRPPTLVWPDGTIANTVNPLRADELAREGIYFYHFSYITDRQVSEKMRYHAHLRMHESEVGIPYLRLLERFPLLQRMWLWLWHGTWMYPLRRKLDSRYFNYSYLETVWRPWDADREGVEKRYNVLPVAPRSRTIRYAGTLPEAVRSHPLYSKKP